MRTPRRLPLPSSLPSSLRALRHRDYRWWAAAGTVSTIGTWLQAATQAWVVLQLSGSGAMLGAGVALSALPSLVLGPWAGVLVDRFPRRNVLLVTRGAFALFAAVQAVGAFAGWLSVPLLLALSFATGLAAVVDAPAAGALGANLVPPEDLANAAALGSATNSLGRIVGMSASGVLIGLAGPGVAFAANAVGFLPTLVVLTRLSHREAPRTGTAERAWPAIRTGFRFVSGTPQLAWLLGLAFLLGALGRNYQVTMALMVEDVLGGGAGAYGMASTAFAVGAFGGAVAAAHLHHVTGRVVVAAGTVGTIGQLGAGLAPGLWTFMAVIVGVAAAAVVLDTAVSTRVATTTPDLLRGRVLAVAAAAGTGAGALGGPLLGSVAESFGPRQALVGGGLLCACALLAAGRGVVGRPDVVAQPMAVPREAATVEHDRPALPAPAAVAVAAA